MEITEEVQKPVEGEETKQETEGAASQPPVETPAPAGDPAAEKTDAEKAEESKEEVAEPAREMTAEQYAKYNETLRRVSKTAHAALAERYNAFEDSDVKAAVKQAVMDGKEPDIAEITAGIVAKRTTPPAEEPTPPPEPQTEKKDEGKDPAAEVTALKVENALLKEGITPERVDAATKLFIAEGGDLGKVKEWVAKYPEWHRQEGEVVFSKAPPVGGKTAPTPADHHELNDFEKKVAEARKKRGLD